MEGQQGGLIADILGDSNKWTLICKNERLFLENEGMTDQIDVTDFRNEFLKITKTSLSLYQKNLIGQGFRIRREIGELITGNEIDMIYSEDIESQLLELILVLSQFPLNEDCSILFQNPLKISQRKIDHLKCDTVVLTKGIHYSSESYAEIVVEDKGILRTKFRIPKVKAELIQFNLFSKQVYHEKEQGYRGGNQIYQQSLEFSNDYFTSKRIDVVLEVYSEGESKITGKINLVSPIREMNIEIIGINPLDVQLDIQFMNSLAYIYQIDFQIEECEFEPEWYLRFLNQKYLSKVRFFAPKRFIYLIGRLIDQRNLHGIVFVYFPMKKDRWLRAKNKQAQVEVRNLKARWLQHAYLFDLIISPLLKQSTSKVLGDLFNEK